MKRKSIDVVPIWFVSKKIKPEKCITGDTLAPEKKALMITGDARGSQQVKTIQKQKLKFCWKMIKLGLMYITFALHVPLMQF